MEFINKNEYVINLLQIFLNNGCFIYGPSVQNLLINHKVHNIQIYVPPEATANMTKYQNYFECLSELGGNNDVNSYEIKNICKTKYLWKINDANLTLTTKKPNPKHDTTQLIITKDGVSTLANSKLKGIDVLKTLRKLTKYEDFDDGLINVSLKWITFLLNNGSKIYGSWPSKFITCECACDLNSDIDILSDDINNLGNLMYLLNDSNVCELGTSNKYDVASLNAKIKSNSGSLILDIHKNSNSITCDAFYNNLRLTIDNLTVNYKPENINFLSALILIFNDLFHSSYTLMKPLPITIKDIKNNGDLRLLTKPISFSENYVISTEYLQKYKDGETKINELNDILLNGECDRSNHTVNDKLNFVPSVIRGDKKKVCLHCIHSDLQNNKKLHNK